MAVTTTGKMAGGTATGLQAEAQWRQRRSDCYAVRPITPIVQPLARLVLRQSDAASRVMRCTSFEMETVSDASSHFLSTRFFCRVATMREAEKYISIADLSYLSTPFRTSSAGLHGDRAI